MAKPDISRQKSDYPTLSVEQENAVDLLIQGKSDREVGELVGVSRQTVASWRLDNVAFIAALNSRRQEIFGSNGERLRSLLSQALDVVADGLNSDDEKTRLSTAWNIIRSVGLDGLVPTGATTPAAVQADREKAALFDMLY